MKKDANGNWLAKIKLSPEQHVYKFVVDGEWMPDPKNNKSLDDGYGGLNSIVIVKLAR